MVRIIEEYIPGPMYDSSIFSEYFSGMNIIVADIETTGLSPKNAAVILGGAVIAEGGGRRAIQFFADTPADERELLERYVGLLRGAHVVVTFNGKRFDLPFLRRRMQYYGLDTAALDRLYSLDIYRILRYHSHLPKILPNLKQKTVEKYLGDSSSRTDEIDGAQSVELYYEYTRSSGQAQASILDTILLHNRDDIVRLSDMMRILQTLNLHEIMNSEGFPASVGEFFAHVETAKLRGGELKVSGSVYGNASPYQCFEELFELRMEGPGGHFDLEIVCEKVPGGLVVDTSALGVDCPSIRSMGGYESGFLILKEGEVINYREINMLVRSVLGFVLQ